jgi:C4-dicarboxylate-specific signal transduction histidine kinase
MTQSNYLHAFEEQESRRTQVIFSLAAILQPIWFLLTEKFYPEQYDYLWPRLVISTVFLAYVFYIDRLPRNKWQRDVFLIFAASLFSLHGLYITWINHWHGHHVLGISLSICVAFTIVHTKKAAWVFATVISLATIALCLFVPEDNHEFLHMIWVAVILIVGMIASYGRLSMINQLIATVTELNIAEQRVRDQHAMIANNAKLRALGEMAGGIAHEINTPLATIGVNAELIDKKLNDKSESKEQIQIAVDRIRQTVDRIAKIIRGMRELVNSNQSDPLESVQIKDIIELIKDLGHERLLRDAVTLYVNCPEDFEIRCRPKQIAQLLLNLINNSFDFLKSEDRAERWIKLEIRRSITQAEIAVLDSGPGIPENLQEKLWQPFFTTKQIGEGMGLGLSISRRIAEDHGGSLTYEPEENVTRFILRLPLKVSNTATGDVKRTG